MSAGLTLGVLSPFLGGWYFGGILSGITGAATAAGANVVAVQTLDAGTNRLELREPPSFAHPVAWEHAAGYIVVANAVNDAYVAALRRDGKPVVAISHGFPGLDCPVVLPDNSSGIRAAVHHLIGHGHRRVAFAGHLAGDDIRERHEAYRETLLAAGIDADRCLTFDTGDNLESGGERAARWMLAAGLPATATIAATDSTALGLMAALTAAGCHLPRDQAIIGFDDRQAAAYATPTLTSVHQPLSEIGRRAVTELIRQVNDGVRGPARQHVETSLVIRESCGCPETVTPETVTPGSGLTEPARPASAAGFGTLPAAMRTPADARFSETNHLQATLTQQFEVSMDLLRGHQEDPRQLGWLGRTSATAGCLALWSGEHAVRTGRDSALEIAGVFARDGSGAPAPVPGAATTVAAFPPPEFIALAGEHPNAVVYVVPTKVQQSDWGLLAIVDGVDPRVGTGREPINQWAALLTVALDHQAMLGTLRRQEARLRSGALYDHLTGLPNRALFLDELGVVMRRGQNGSEPEFGVLFLDLDDFKVINDSLGHSAGDELLVQVAERIRAGLSPSDLAARFGGDEFLVLLDAIGHRRVPVEVADQLHAALARPFPVQGQEVVISTSIGITLGDPRYDDPEALVRDADIAMYSAKSRRKGSHAIFDVTMHDRAVSRLRTETELRQALERDELEVHYQPIVDLRTGETHGFEALLRWRHPTRGLIPPAQFLGVAEESGLILPISRWVLGESCRQLGIWQRVWGRTDLRISVNISDRQFWHDNLAEDVDWYLRHNRLAARCLALEITEGVIMRNIDRARTILEELHHLGCEVHIDDFGTGYSSLEALHQLPIDVLKIDRSFVSRLGADRRSAELVRTIVLMGHNLGLELIAEGIETPAQRDHIMRLGCVLGQGYLLAQPMPAAQAEEQIRTYR
ncbi:EAL domain-containing protein [Micromonospora sp. NPDC049679]|uniref:EAL domain-containing protein n=1 Tax=Micromonospora sp. NPDC049679 TaxID=3155920 RepID=UPI0033FDB9F9